MSRHISHQYAQNNSLTCLTVDPQLENTISGAVQRTERGSYVALDPKTTQAVINSLTKEMPKLTGMGYQPVVLTSPAVRLHFRKMTERVAPNLTVLSYAELEPKIEVQALGVVKI
jgi:flagellar biosynthesis protein FlhA